MVAEDDDDRLLGDAGGFEGAEEAGDLVVDKADHSEVDLAQPLHVRRRGGRRVQELTGEALPERLVVQLAGTCGGHADILAAVHRGVRLRDDVRWVRVRVREPKKEGVLAIVGIPDHVDRGARQPPRRCRLDVVRRPLDEWLVEAARAASTHGALIGVGILVLRAAGVVIADDVVEAASKPLIVEEVVLTDKHRPVAGRAQRPSQVRHIRRERITRSRPQAPSVWVAAGEDRRPRRNAERHGHEPILDEHPASGERVQVRCSDARGAIAAERIPAQLIGHDHHEIRVVQCVRTVGLIRWSRVPHRL